MSVSGKTSELLQHLLPKPGVKKDWFLCADGGGGIALIKNQADQRQYVEALFKDKEVTQRDISKICDKLLLMRIAIDTLTSSFEDLIEVYPFSKQAEAQLCQIVNYDNVKQTEECQPCE